MKILKIHRRKWFYFPTICLIILCDICVGLWRGGQRYRNTLYTLRHRNNTTKMTVDRDTVRNKSFSWPFPILLPFLLNCSDFLQLKMIYNSTLQKWPAITPLIHTDHLLVPRKWLSKVKSQSSNTASPAKYSDLHEPRTAVSVTTVSVSDDAYSINFVPVSTWLFHPLCNCVSQFLTYLSIPHISAYSSHICQLKDF